MDGCITSISESANMVNKISDRAKIESFYYKNQSKGNFDRLKILKK